MVFERKVFFFESVFGVQNATPKTEGTLCTFTLLVLVFGPENGRIFVAAPFWQAAFSALEEGLDLEGPAGSGNAHGIDWPIEALPKQENMQWVWSGLGRSGEVAIMDSVLSIMLCSCIARQGHVLSAPAPMHSCIVHYPSCSVRESRARVIMHGVAVPPISMRCTYMFCHLSLKPLRPRRLFLHHLVPL